jgi:hypothetical protein
MPDFKIPLVHQNPCLQTISHLTVEVAVIIRQSFKKMRIAWESIRVELPYCSHTGDQLFVLEIPEGECTIPLGYSVYTFIRHVVEIPAEIEQSRTVSFSKKSFSYLKGVFKLNHDKVPLLLKWRFTVTQKDGLIVSPWSYCYGGKQENSPGPHLSNTSINITSIPGKSEAQIKILDSISCEEFGMAEILRAEAEKIKKTIEVATDIKDIISVGDSVQATLKKLIKYQILLQLKLEDAVK